MEWHHSHQDFSWCTTYVDRACILCSQACPVAMAAACTPQLKSGMSSAWHVHAMCFTCAWHVPDMTSIRIERPHAVTVFR